MGKNFKAHKLGPGLKFNRLTCVERLPNNAQNQPVWRCKCDCGNEKLATAFNLVHSRTKSCGCLMREVMREHSTKHGMGGRRAAVWMALIARCYNPENKDFKNYGGRGICVCSGVKSTPAILYEALGDKPSPRHQVDRQDTNGHYSCGKCDECIRQSWPNNLRWSTPIVQARNKRNNAIVSYKGQKYVLAELAEKLGVPYATLRPRIRKGFPEETWAITGRRVNRGLYTKRASCWGAQKSA